MNKTVEELEAELAEWHKDAQFAETPEDKAIMESAKKAIMADLVQAYQRSTAEETASSPMQALKVGIGSGMNRVFQDVSTLPFIASDSFDQRRQAVHDERALMQPLTNISSPANMGEVLGGVAATLPLGGFSGVTSQALGGAGRVAANAALGAAQGALGAEDPLAGALIGGAGTGLMQGATEGIGMLARRGVPNVGSSFNDIPILPADTPGFFSGAETFASSIPGPASAVRIARQKQQEAIRRAAEDLASRARDPGVDIKESLKAAKDSRKTIAGRLYDNVEANMPPGPVPNQTWRTPAMATYTEEILKPEGRRNMDLLRTVNGYLDEVPDATWSQLRKLRSDIKADVRSAYKGGSQVGENGVGKLAEIRKAVEDDLRNSASGQLNDAWTAADDFYRTNVIQPYGRGSPSVVRTAMNKESSGEAEKMFLSPRVAGNAELVDNVFTGLDPGGREVIANRLVQDMMEKATSPDGTINPRAMAAYIHERGPAFARFLSKEEMGKVQKILGKIAPHDDAAYSTTRRIAGALPLLAGTAGATLPPSSNDASGAVDRFSTAAGFAGGAVAAEAGLGSIAAALATGRPGPVLNALLRTAITTTGRLHGEEEY